MKNKYSENKIPYEKKEIPPRNANSNSPPTVIV